MPPQPDDRERARVREALIDLCFERSYAKTTLPMILERAGVDLATFNLQFDDLEDCFFQIYRAELERYQREAADARAVFSRWRDRVRATAYALYRFLAADERVRWFTVVEVRAASERTQLLIGGEIELLFDLIDEGRREPGALASLTRATAESVGGGIFNRIYTTAGQRGLMPSEEKIVPQLMYAAVLPYLGPELAQEELSIPPPPPG